MKHRSRSLAFTIVETLVVIAIVLVLAGLVASVMNAAKGKANQAKVIANLRTMSQGLVLYSEDNFGHFPAGPDSWMYVARSYWGNETRVEQNPSYPPRPFGTDPTIVYPPGKISVDDISGNGKGFAMNSCLKLNRVSSEPKVLIFESAQSMKETFGHLSHGITITPMDNPWPDVFRKTQDEDYGLKPIGGRYLADHRNGKAYYAFEDTSVSLKPVSDFVNDECRMIPNEKNYFATLEPRRESR